MTLEEFKTTYRYVGKGETRKVRNSWGSYDFYKYYRVHRPDEHKYVLYECVYFAILKKVNLLLQDELCKTGALNLPYNMGRLILVNKERRTYMYGGKARTTKPIDWGKTLELWYNDEQAKKDKTLIHRENTHDNLCYYSKTNAIFKNKIFYHYSISRRLRDRITKKIDCVDGIAYYNRKDAELFKGLYNG